MNLQSLKTKFMVKTYIVLIVLLGITGLYFTRPSTRNQPIAAQAQISVELRTYTEAELAQYTGVDPIKPILLALDGSVYDVTAGKEFYQPGGSYHDLAGKDSSAELHLVGGDIIKRKYPIVGTLAK